MILKCAWSTTALVIAVVAPLVLAAGPSFA